MRMNTELRLRIPIPLAEALERECSRSGSSLSEFTRQALLARLDAGAPKGTEPRATHQTAQNQQRDGVS